MDIFRKIGIGVTMIVPAFVFAGLVWQFLHSWLAVLGVEVVMVILYQRILTGRFLTSADDFS